MKIKSIHIENFGNLSGYEREFSDELNVFTERNGYGKTTISAFIKAMLYGLKPCRVNSKDFTDREHYYPFGGGKFGGNMVFEANGKVYRIERFFDEKSDVRDNLKFEENGKVIDEGEPGKYIFGIDEEDFSRTIIINSEAFSEATGGISRKLNDFAANVKEDEGIEVALAVLDEKIKNLQKRGGAGEIDLLKTRKTNLETRLKELKGEEETRSIDYAKLAEIDGQIKEKDELLKRASEERLRAETAKTLKTYTDRAARARERMTEIEKKYGGKAPTVSEAMELAESFAANEQDERLVEEWTFSEEKENRLNGYKVRFGRGIPGEDETAFAENAYAEKQRREQSLSERNAAQKTEREEELDREFNGRLPDPERAAAAREAAKRWKSYVEESDALSENRAYNSINKPKNSLKTILIAILSVGILAGIGLAFLNLIAGIAVCGVCFVSLTISLAVSAKNATNTSASSRDELNRKILEEKKIVGEFLASYGKYAVSYAQMYEFDAEVAEYKRILENRLEVARKNGEDEEKIKSCAAALSEFFEKYGVTGENGFSELRSAVVDYRNLISVKGESDDKKKTAEAGMKERLEKMRAFFINRGIPLGETVSLKDKKDEAVKDADEYERMKEEEKEETARAEKFREENGITEGSGYGEITLDEEGIKNELDALRKKRAEIDAELDEVEDKLRWLAQTERDLEEVKDEIEKKTKDKDIFKKTKELLQKADESLREKYVAPVKDRFLYYSEKTEKALGEKMTMGKDYSVRFEKNGERKEDKYLSAGQRSVCSLCLRLALIDNMYEKEKPFIIMDDPFINLDEEHLKSVKSLVKLLAADRQIIYLSCHESRAL